MADNTRSKKNFLGFFALLGVVTTALLFTVNQGDWLTAACLYALATIGFLGGNVFYDAMITNVATDRNIDGVSAFGYSPWLSRRWHSLCCQRADVPVSPIFSALPMELMV